MALDAGNDGSLLDGTRLLKTVTVNTSKELWVQVHVIEGLVHLVPSALDLAILNVNVAILFQPVSRLAVGGGFGTGVIGVLRAFGRLLVVFALSITECFDNDVEENSGVFRFFFSFPKL